VDYALILCLIIKFAGMAELRWKIELENNRRRILIPNLKKNIVE